jgi:hypothetical protein
MGQQARANRAALGTEYTGKHGHHGVAAKTGARGAHNKARLERLNDRFRKAELPTQSTLCKAEAQRKSMFTLLAARQAEKKEKGSKALQQELEAVEKFGDERNEERRERSGVGRNKRKK